MLPADINRSIALQWIDAFNEHDIEKLLSLYADDAIHFSPKLKIKQPETQGWVSGKDALRHWWAGSFQSIPSLQYNLVNLIVNEAQLLMEYLRKADGAPDMMVAEILEISNGLIIKSRVYHS
ncbi:MAG: nuclear transport factor 2 family protein [Bacteroidetes bacterium]|nr:nuclear transport factor 2 family protein [Bacteroidota bacterium]